MKVKVIKCRNSKWGKIGFLHVLGQYLERYMKEKTKTTGLCTKNNTSCTKNNTSVNKNTILKCMIFFKCEGQGHQMLNFQNVNKNGIFTCYGTIVR